MKNYFYIVLYYLIVLISTSCSDSDSFQYKDRINLYLKEVQNITINEEAIVIIFSGGCGTCNERSIELTKKISSSPQFSSIKKYIILPEIHSSHTKDFGSTEFTVLIDREFNTGRYGLDFDKNLLIHYKNAKKIIYWQWLYMEFFYNVAKEYGFDGL